MLTKEKIIESIKNLPDNFSYEDVMDRIVLLQKIDMGIEQVQEGKIQSTEEAKNKLNKWLK